MSKPNINIPTEFAINGDKTDFSQAKITNGFDRLQPDVLPGDNLNKLIDDTYKGLNGVLELYEGCVLYDSTVTYTNKSLVFNITNDGIKLYHSLQNGNINHALTDKQYWEEVNIGGDLLNLKADNDFSNVTAPVKDFIDMVTSWSIPDWNGGFAIPTSYTTPSAGLVFASFTSTRNISPSLKINGHDIWYDYSFNGSMRVVVGKGNNLAFSNTSDRYFYPLKGVK